MIEKDLASCPHCGELFQSPGLLSRFFFAICHPVVAIILAAGIIGLGVLLIL